MFKVVVLVLSAVSLIGAKPSRPRIIGGSNAEQGEFPYLVSLQHPLTHFHFCGASIINENHLITAGHCLHGQIALQVTAYIGSAFLDQGGSYHPASHLTVHPEYDPNREGVNDVGIVKLRNSIQFGGDVQPINLPIGITVNAGDEATATGWGDISYPNEQTPNQLQKLTEKVVCNEDCRSALGPLGGNINDGNICFGGDDGHGLCFGDSGSPLVFTQDGKDYAIGVVSWGNPCGIGYPDVYGRISYFLPWIQENIQ